MSNIITDNQHYQDIANAIRTKNGTANQYKPSQMSAAILNIQTSSGVSITLQSKTVSPTTSQQIVSCDSGYDGLSSVTINAIPTATQATPSISVNNNTGVITASATQTAGYVAAGTKSKTYNLSTQSATTIVPSVNEQTAVMAGKYTIGDVKVAGDSNLVPANIKSGISIFGISGTYSGSTGSGGGAPSVITAGDTVVVASTGYAKASSSSLTAGTLSVVVPVSGRYRIKYGTSHDRSGYTPISQLYKNGTGLGEQQSILGEVTYDADLSAGDVISVRVGGGSISYRTHAFGLCLCIDWDNGF